VSVLCIAKGPIPPDPFLRTSSGTNLRRSCHLLVVQVKASKELPTGWYCVLDLCVPPLTVKSSS
jgi:hypothetical protein